MCILLKLDYATFGGSNLFFQKLSKKNLWGVAQLPPPPLTLVQEGLKVFSVAMEIMFKLQQCKQKLLLFQRMFVPLTNFVRLFQ